MTLKQETPLPSPFLERMNLFLGEEFPAFAESLHAAPVSGLRVNGLKISPQEFKTISPFQLGDAVPWCPSAFTIGGEQRAGLHPYHLAGLYYLQDPSAMSPAELISPQPGERILDLAAAPGGKTTHLASLMNGKGLLVANEIKNKRVGHLAQNVERWGAGNVIITNESPERLADHFGPYFDRVLVDAPCSGEGMFRKDMGAREDWSLEMVAGCAVRQKNILHIAAKLVRPGGYLLYSTCTFAPEEDEGVIEDLLNDQSEFEVVDLHQSDGFASGKPEWIDARPALAGAVRLFPHRLRGEGHFACLLKRKISPIKSRVYESRLSGLSRQEILLWGNFASDVLQMELDEDRLNVVGDRLYYLPEIHPDMGRLRIVHWGVWLGTFKKDRFEPAHPLAMYAKRGQIRKTHSLLSSDAALHSYLHGETLATELNGWTAVTVDDYPIGWGKGVQGVLKNHFPRGWMV